MICLAKHLCMCVLVFILNFVYLPSHSRWWVGDHVSLSSHVWCLFTSLFIAYTCCLNLLVCNSIFILGHNHTHTLTHRSEPVITAPIITSPTASKHKPLTSTLSTQSLDSPTSPPPNSPPGKSTIATHVCCIYSSQKKNHIHLLGCHNYVVSVDLLHGLFTLEVSNKSPVWMCQVDLC